MPESNTVKRIEFFQMLCRLGDFAWLKNIRIMPTSFFRTAEEQARLFKDGKSKCDGKSKMSLHQRGRAMDFVIVDVDDEPLWESQDYKELGQFWEAIGGVWGGRWKDPHDPYHFEC